MKVETTWGGDVEMAVILFLTKLKESLPIHGSLTKTEVSTKIEQDSKQQKDYRGENFRAYVSKIEKENKELKIRLCQK